MRDQNTIRKVVWWLHNRSRINVVLQRESDMGYAHCRAFHFADRDKKTAVMKEIRRHRRNLDRLKQLHSGKSPWDTANMDGWQQRDASFRLMEIGSE